MMLWLLLSVALCVSGMPRLPSLPPLPMEDGCLVVSPEVKLFRVEGEAVILSFPFFHSVLKAHRMSLSGASVLISKVNHTKNSAHNTTYNPAPKDTNSSAHNMTSSPVRDTEGRVLQQGAQLWLLPAQESDSGQYTCTYRSERFCVRGRLNLQVYSSPSMHIDKLRYSIRLSEGESLFFRCPSLSVFNHTETHIHWDKVSGARGPFDSTRGFLMIQEVHREHSGLYRCQATVVLKQREYRVSRALLITVQENPRPLPSDLPMTPDPRPITTEISPEPAPPKILSPLNGTIFENSHGSGMELFCTVLTDCPTAESTEVTWLVNGQSVESSYLNGRALQGGMRVGRVAEGCHVELLLMILEMRERDTEVELKCVAQNQHGRQEVDVRLQLEDSTHTWLVVFGVAILCLLSVLSVFLCVIFKPRSSRTKLDYTLANRHSSSCLSSDLS
ncbi:interleukin-1 receptor type 2 [Periophthalmus magnuspinnatus]|uniref:interleukin-1 receptor type 2 n=1 Tax=Periophthalmus magnuspinnatus TaxID=409849 RepID=UPI0024368653|nr:interleukin-1 receptor type 2 [Periophthalmus magnuspinnatus]